MRIANCDLSKCLNKDANKMRIEISDMHDDITQSLARIAKKMRIANIKMQCCYHAENCELRFAA